MNYKMVLRICGRVLEIESVLLIFPAIIAVANREPVHGFIIAALI